MTSDQRAVGLDVFHKRDGINALVDIHGLAVTVIDKYKSAFVRMHHILLAVAFQEHELAHGRVEIPGIVRQFLVIGLQLTSIGIKQDY